jgi:SAM-dependent methyltransferase
MDLVKEEGSHNKWFSFRTWAGKKLDRFFPTQGGLLTMGNKLYRIFPTARGLLIERSLRQIDLKSFNSILVIGAGRDPLRGLFGTHKRYITLDVAYYHGRTDLVADAHAVPFATGSFDCIFASEVVEHLSSPQIFVSEVRRLLVPGGKVVLTVPFMFHSHADPNDYWRITREGFQKVFSDFSSVDIYAQGNRLHVLSDLVTTAFSPIPLFAPLRVMNHIFRLFQAGTGLTDSVSSAPSGFLVIAIK